MIVNEANLALLFDGFSAVYTDAYLQAETNWEKIAMKVASEGSSEAYSWLGQFPQLREWIGPREVKNLKSYGFRIVNRTFESTVAVKRESVEDDRIGVFKPAFSEMGYLAKMHPEELIMGLLAKGFDEKCYDGEHFFDTEHVVKNAADETTRVSNMQEGDGPAWFLLDTSRSVKPLVWQERVGYEFTPVTSHGDAHVFMNDQYLYGVRARVNAGFGLWQLGFGSKADLTIENYTAARAAMMNFRADGGRVLGVKPNAIVVPPELEDAALKILNTETNDGGGSNPWKNTAEVIVSPFATAA